MLTNLRSLVSRSTLLIVVLGVLMLLPGVSLAQDAPIELRQVREVPRTSQVWNGANSLIELQPWLVTVFTNASFCGGMLVQYEWVITAAHCVEADTFTQVTAGSTSFENAVWQSNQDRQDREVVQKVLHPAYDSNNFVFDIAILRLDSPMVPSPKVGLINLVTETPQPGPALLAGFGDLTDEFSTSFPPLQLGEMSIVSDATCDAIFQNYSAVNGYSWSGLFETDLCTVPGPAHAGGCSGDSGAPLVVNSEDGGIPLAAGVVAWGINCETEPTVFTDIAVVRPWIDSVLPDIATCNGLWPTISATAGVPTGGTAFGDVIWGTNDADVINARGGHDLVCGLGGDDVIVGGDGNDVIYGNSGNDRLVGNAGADRLIGGPGNDTQLGGPGNDSLYGVTGADVLRGDDGDDILWGFSGDDQMFGGNGNDFFAGHAGDDLMSGDAGKDKMFGGIGLDDLRGGDGPDTLSGGTQNDVLSGGVGDDVILGDQGNDTLAGQAGNDTLRGLNGNDSLYGGPGVDFCDGGLGIDATNATCQTQVGFP